MNTDAPTPQPPAAAEDGVPNPPLFFGAETGWLEPHMTRVAEECARAGAAEAILRSARLPTAAEVQTVVTASALGDWPDWERHMREVQHARVDFVAVVLRDDISLDDDPSTLLDRLDELAASPAAPTSDAAFVRSLSTPTLLCLKCVVDALHAMIPGWDSRPPPTPPPTV